MSPQEAIDYAAIYQPLDERKKEIRIVLVYPSIDLSTGDQLPVCRLQTASLLDEPTPHYEAISYAWGERTGVAPVIINDQHRQHPASAIRVLQRFAPAEGSEPRRLWIDAICINQRDVAERNQQVAMMSDVYRNSSQTLVWLGEADANTAAAFEQIDVVLKDMKNELGTADSTPQQINDSFKRSRFSDRIKRFADIAAFHALLDRSWFSRMWVLQEILLSRAVICCCGQYRVRWRALSQSITWVGQPAIAAFQLADASVRRADFSLAQLLLRGLYLQVSDPKDKIYAGLGLVQGTMDNLPRRLQPQIDYSRSLCDIYAEATFAAIVCVGNLRLLEMAEDTKICTIPSSEDDPKFPSWLPRWQRSNVVPRVYGTDRHADAGSRLEGDLRKHCQLWILGLKGFVVGEISHTHAMSELSLECDCPSALAAVQRAKTFAKDSAAKESEEDSTVSDRLIVDTMAGGFFSDIYYSESTFQAALVEIEGFLNDSNRGDVAYSQLLKGCAGFLHYTGYKRRLFRTSTTAFGLGPGDLRVGDVVVILFGGQAPFVLRRKPSPGRYSFVGACYIHDIMHGEAVHEHKASGIPDTLFEIE